jgi:hypothetical protein
VDRSWTWTGIGLVAAICGVGAEEENSLTPELLSRIYRQYFFLSTAAAFEHISSKFHIACCYCLSSPQFRDKKSSRWLHFHHSSTRSSLPFQTSPRRFARAIYRIRQGHWNGDSLSCGSCTGGATYLFSLCLAYRTKLVIQVEG